MINTDHDNRIKVLERKNTAVEKYLADLRDRVTTLSDGKLGGNNSVKDQNIDWGVKHEQVNARNIPILDKGDLFSVTTVEKALQEVSGAKAQFYADQNQALSGATDLEFGSADFNNTDYFEKTSDTETTFQKTGTIEIEYQITSTNGCRVRPLLDGVAQDRGIAYERNYATWNSLTSGYIPYYDGTDLVDSPAYTDATSIGIGTTSPASLLEIASSTADAIITIDYENTDDVGDPQLVLAENGTGLYAIGVDTDKTYSPNALLITPNATVGGQTTGICMDTTGRIGLNTDADNLYNAILDITPSYTSPVYYDIQIYDVTANFTDNHWCMNMVLTKTAGASTNASIFRGTTNVITLNQSGGTIGKIEAGYYSADILDGTISDDGTQDGSIKGFLADLDIHGGTVEGDSVALKADIEMDGGTAENLYGALINVNVSAGTQNGSVYGLLIKETAGMDYGISVDKSILIKEQSAAATDIAAYGQIWVKDDTPNTLWFTDDGGTDHQLGTSDISGLTTNYFPIAASATSLTDSIIQQNGLHIEIAGDELILQGQSGVGNQTARFSLVTYGTGDSAYISFCDVNTSGEKARVGWNGGGGDDYLYIQSDGNIYMLPATSAGTGVGIGIESPGTFIEAMDASPYITLHNETHENTDNGRESRIYGRGQQSGGETSNLGYFEFSHDGASNDQKGKVRIFVNDGDDGNSPSIEALTILSDGILYASQGLRTISSDDNVSDPPTDAELDTAFGTPATVGDNFIGVLDDNGGGADVWLCVAKNSTWWYTQLTAAV